MNDKQKLKRILTNILNSMLKAKEAPASAEMHLIESVDMLSEILNIDDLNDVEMNEQLNYCKQIMNELKKNIS